jgi:CHAD domain-containing protein
VIAGRDTLQVGKTPGLSPQDTMDEAGRKIFAFHLARMLKEEARLTEADNTNPIHDMRVATRRMRSAFEMFRSFYGKSTAMPLRQHLRLVANRLGAARDIDVQRELLAAYAEKADEPESRPENGLAPLFDHFVQEKKEAERELFALIHGNAYAAFIGDFLTFVQTPGMGSKKGILMPRVCDAAPALIYEEFGRLRAHGPHLNKANLDEWHELRIVFKRLRYALEAFAEVLGEDSAQVVAAIKQMQEHLGNLQDARVSMDTARQYLDLHASDSAAPQTPHTWAVWRYMMASGERLHGLLEESPARWVEFDIPAIRQALANAIAYL